METAEISGDAGASGGLGGSEQPARGQSSRASSRPPDNSVFFEAGQWVDRIRVNRVDRISLGGAVYWRKERMRAAAWLLPLANRFFGWARNPVRAIVCNKEWRAREIALFDRLHGVTAPEPDETGALLLPELCGTDLSRLLECGRLGREALVAAGRELRRVHATVDAATGNPFSHGDPHLANFVFDRESGRARLIDFEVRHLAGLPAHERFADDLLVFLQDLVGRIERKAWVSSAVDFLEGYADRVVIAVLKERLALPGGLPRVWWAVRTSYMSGRELRERLADLKAAIG